MHRLIYKFTRPNLETPWWHDTGNPEIEALCEYQLNMYGRELNPATDKLINYQDSTGLIYYFGHECSEEQDQRFKQLYSTDETLLLIHSWIHEYYWLIDGEIEIIDEPF